MFVRWDLIGLDFSDLSSTPMSWLCDRLRDKLANVRS